VGVGHTRAIVKKLDGDGETQKKLENGKRRRKTDPQLNALSENKAAELKGERTKGAKRIKTTRIKDTEKPAPERRADTGNEKHGTRDWCDNLFHYTCDATSRSR